MRKDGADQKQVQAAKDNDPGNPTIDFKGEPRRNDTHQSTTDPESVLYRKAKGKEAKLCFGGHILMNNRHGLCGDFTPHNPIIERSRRWPCGNWINSSRCNAGPIPKRWVPTKGNTKERS